MHRFARRTRNDKPYAQGALNEFFETFVKNLEKFRIGEKEGAFDDQIIENIENFLPYRNEAVEIFLALAQYGDLTEAPKQLHRFFEGLLPYLDRPEHLMSWNENDFDNFKFIVHELFLYAVASLLKYERFKATSYLLNQGYYLKKWNEPAGVISYSQIRPYLGSLKSRNKRLNLRRLSLHADLLENRAKSFGFEFMPIMQADFVLYIRDCLESLQHNTRQRWYPVTLLYMDEYGGAFEIFARAQSNGYFDELKQLFSIAVKTDFDPIFKAFQDGKLIVPSWDFHTVNPVSLMAYDSLATRP